ncbi:MAG: hypothetical protein ABI369_12910 [Acetobacteraceae bacterium]
MITVKSAQPARLHTALAVGAAAIFCAGLAACSSSSGTTSPSIHTTGPAGQSRPSFASAAPASVAPAAAAGSACGLVTLPEVTTAAGKPMTVSGDAGSICTFSATTDPSFLIAVQIYADAHSMALMTQLEPSSEHLAGLGDDAFWAAAPGVVFVKKGSRAFAVVPPSLANLSTSPAAVKAKLVTLATAALTRF